MNSALRQAAAASGALACLALLLAGAVSVGHSLWSQQAEATALAEQVEVFRAREARVEKRPGGERGVSASFAAGTITLAGAALQQQVEAAVAKAKGRLVSSKVDVASHAAENQLAISAEMILPEPGVQALLFDLETGRPYLFVDAFEARASEGAGESDVLHVSLSLSGQWSAEK